MVKSELIARLVKSHPYLPTADVADMVDRVFELIAESLVNGDRVEVRGLGTFHIGSRAPRRMVDPRTREARQLPQRNTILFKPGSWFRNRDPEK